VKQQLVVVTPAAHDEALPFGDAEPLHQRLVESVGEAALLFRREAVRLGYRRRKHAFRLSMTAMRWIGHYLDNRE
jgi:hypothetical protein